MNARRAGISASVVLAVFIVGIWRAGPSSEQPAYVGSEVVQPISTVFEAGESGSSPGLNRRSRFLVTAESDPLIGLVGEGLNRVDGSVERDLRIVEEVLTAWRTNFPGRGNPVGMNREITASLAGRNQLQLDLIPADHPAINSLGELCDRWGSPFVFHQISGLHMEIRSAGPDWQAYSDDDVVLNAGDTLDPD